MRRTDDANTTLPTSGGFSFAQSTARFVGDLAKAFVPLPAKNPKRSVSKYPRVLTACDFFAFDCLKLFCRNSHRIQYDNNSERMANV
jgi:hypothetical protein